MLGHAWPGEVGKSNAQSTSHSTHEAQKVSTMPHLGRAAKKGCRTGSGRNSNQMATHFEPAKPGTKKALPCSPQLPRSLDGDRRPYLSMKCLWPIMWLIRPQGQQQTETQEESWRLLQRPARKKGVRQPDASAKCPGARMRQRHLCIRGRPSSEAAMMKDMVSRQVGRLRMALAALSRR